MNQIDYLYLLAANLRDHNEYIQYTSKSDYQDFHMILSKMDKHTLSLNESSPRWLRYSFKLNNKTFFKRKPKAEHLE